ncbi:glycosyltransferase [Clostridium perfringens]|nr:glycosyltransferase [Clostridium perfringens]
MKSDIMVSINCITYNHEKFIEQTLKSFLNQKTNFKFEILIHDDASTDNTQNIIKKYSEKYPNIIKPILQKENQYSKGTKRIGYLFNTKRANGKYIAFCEGDDYWNDDLKLQKQVDIMENNKDISMCFHSAIIKDESNGSEREEKAYNKSCFSNIRDIILNGGGFCPTASLMYRNDLLEDFPEFYLNAHVGDYPLQMILASLGKVYYINEPMCVYRTKVKGSWSSRAFSKDNIFEKIIKNNKNDIKLLNNFNEFTNKKFNDFINEKIKRCKFNIYSINGDIKSIKDEDYKVLFSELSFKEKLKIYLRNISPKLYIKLYNIKNNYY